MKLKTEEFGDVVIFSECCPGKDATLHLGPNEGPHAVVILSRGEARRLAEAMMKWADAAKPSKGKAEARK